MGMHRRMCVHKRYISGRRSSLYGLGRVVADKEPLKCIFFVYFGRKRGFASIHICLDLQKRGYRNLSCIPSD